jgi:hypothetical protein
MILYVAPNSDVMFTLPPREAPKPVSASSRFCPQTVKILGHLRAVGDISGVEAAAMYRCRSLTKRIAELRADGFGIESVYSKDHTGQRYVRYFLRDDKAHVVI